MRSDPTFVRGRLQLADGRRLTYSETGPRDGTPVLYCHGAIGTPLGATVDLEAITSELGVRYIAISRPGIGGSDPAPGRTVLDFAADVRELVDELEIDRLKVVGVSAGGPYALAVARELSDRVDRVAVCSSLSPLCAPHRTPGMWRRIRLALSVLARAPGTCAAVGDLAVPAIRRHPELLSRVIAAHAAPGERQLLQRADECSAASTSFLDAASEGVRGMIEDYLVYSSPWGFEPTEVSTPAHLWHGLEDPLVPVDHALQLAISLPRCRVFLDADEGHHFFRRRLGKILAVLVGREHDPGEEVVATLASMRARGGRRAPARKRRS
ncbi:MAG TPA: alpha/beta fold hydrolase [Solirubrobacteraceae bacterium]|jgi:pimeloyl-ACP methyl ester carboxylesterase|nr:alpha/beta fold hydrolase [Solirubrobacteraceae bacterium]